MIALLIIIIMQHNLEEAYQGRIFPSTAHDDMAYIHNLPRDWLIDPHWHQVCLNACMFVSLFIYCFYFEIVF